MILFLKEKKYITLQIACGDILDVQIMGNNFVINTTEQIVYDTIMLEKNQQILKDAFAWQNLSFKIIVNRILKQEEQQAKDFDKLRMLGIEFKKEGKYE